MKEDMLEVLVYLFEHYMVEGQDLDADQEDIEAELIGAGFEGVEIDKAFLWLEELLIVCEQNALEPFVQGGGNLVRHYLDQETSRLTGEGQALLDRLVLCGVLDLNSREMVIDRVMALDSKDVSLDHIKWVVLLVLSNQPGGDEVADWAEPIVNGGSVALLH